LTRKGGKKERWRLIRYFWEGKEFFKIHQGGLFPNGTWVTKAFEADNSTWTINLPTDIRPGQYILRQEQVSSQKKKKNLEI
jgi:hypothetical protein